MSVHSAIFTAAKDSLKGGVVNRQRLVESLGCDPDDERVQTLLTDLLLTVDAFARACEDASLPHPQTGRKRKFT